jgi:transcriptional regulator with XRE-family HTH domain
MSSAIVTGWPPIDDEIPSIGGSFDPACRSSVVVVDAVPSQSPRWGMARPHDLRVRFGERVRQLRRQRDLTLEQLGERSKLSDKFVQAIETGRQAPTIETIDKLARGLSVTAYELFISDDVTPRALRARARELVAEASDSEIARIVRLLEAALH